MVLWGWSPSTTKAAAVLTFWGKSSGCSGSCFPQQGNLHLLIALRMTLESVAGMPRSFPGSEGSFPQSLAVILWEQAARCEAAAAARVGPLQAGDAPVLVSPLEMSPVKSLHSSRTRTWRRCRLAAPSPWKCPGVSLPVHGTSSSREGRQSSACAKPWSILFLQDTECRAKGHDWTSKIELGLFVLTWESYSYND